MGKLDRDPIPPYAVTMWTNGIEIFVAMPMKDKSLPPHIISFAYSEDGLAKALRVLQKPAPEAPQPTTAQPANYTKPATQPQVKVGKRREALLNETTQDQRDAAQALLRKLGLVK